MSHCSNCNPFRPAVCVFGGAFFDEVTHRRKMGAWEVEKFGQRGFSVSSM